MRDRDSRPTTLRLGSWFGAAAAALTLSYGSPAHAQTPRWRAPSPASMPAVADRFQGNVSALREQVELLKNTPPPPDNEDTRRAVAMLADALESVPNAQEVDVVTAANTMREDLPDNVGGGQRPETAPGLQTRLALQTAGGVFFLLAQGPYVRVPTLMARVTAFRRAADTIDDRASLGAQRGTVIRSLSLAVDVLLGLEAAS